MKLSVITISALMAVSINSAAQTGTPKPVPGKSSKAQKDAGGKHVAASKGKSNNAQTGNSKEATKKLLEEYQRRLDSLNQEGAYCGPCGMG